LGEAPSFGETIIMHDASSKGAINYLNLAREILQKNNLAGVPTQREKLSQREKLFKAEETKKIKMN